MVQISAIHKLGKSIGGRNSGIVLLLMSGSGALLFTLLAGLLVSSNTRRLVTATERVDHTHEILSSLQRTSLLAERIEYRTNLYLATGNEEHLNRARSTANQLETATVHLRQLVADSPSESANAQNLAACTSELNQIVDRFKITPMGTEVAWQRCEETIGLMIDHEEGLLKEQNVRSGTDVIESVRTELIFVCLSLVVLLVLFWLLLRDAVMRKRATLKRVSANEQLAASVRDLEDRAEELGLMTAVRDELQLCVTVQEVYQTSVSGFSRLLPGATGALGVINNSRQLVEVVRSFGVTDIEDFHPPDCCCGLRSGQPRWRLPEVSEIHCTHFMGLAPERYLCMPIVAHGNTLGVLYVQCQTDEIATVVKDHMDGLRQLVQLTGMAIASLNLRTRLEHQSIRDPLTGLFNRHFMQISLEREMARASRRNQMLTILMLDLDHFKQFNDQHGHAAGDKVLQAVAEVFRTSVRLEDTVCRYGGEEFMIMLPDANAEQGFDRAESIRCAVTEVRVPLERGIHGEFTISIGLAMYPGDGETVEQLMGRADQALYRAKRSGRNQVAVFEPADSLVSTSTM